MEQNSRKFNNDDIIELVEVFDEDMEKRHILCLPDNKDRFRLVVTSFLSMLFHGCIYALVSYASVTYPVISATSDKEIIWLYPSLLLGSMQSSDNADKTENSSTDTSSHDKSVKTDPADLEHKETQEQTLDEGINIFTKPVIIPKAVKPVIIKQHVAAPTVKEPAKVVATPEQQDISPPENNEHPKEDSLPPPQPAVAPPLITPAEAIASPPAIQKDNLSAAAKEKPVFDNASVKALNAPPPTAIVTPKPAETVKPRQTIKPVPIVIKKVKPDVPIAKREYIKPQTKTAIKQTNAKIAAATPQETVKRAKPAPLVKAALPLPPKNLPKEPLKDLASASNRNKTSPVKERTNEIAKTEPEKKPKGLFIPPLPGDLKFEITSDENIQRGVKVTVLFRDFPKARRSRSLSKSEATRIVPFSAKTVFTSPNTILAIVENSAEGVFYLRIALEHKESIKGAVSIKLFESGPRAATKSIKKLTFKNNETIARILMPEGVLWEDSSAFTGSMEDSDSITRYNSDTGLIWKEYH